MINKTATKHATKRIDLNIYVGKKRLFYNQTNIFRHTNLDLKFFNIIYVLHILTKLENFNFLFD